MLPLLAAFSVIFGNLPPMPTITTQTFYGDVQNIASGMIPRIYGRSYAIEVELSVPEEGAEGVLIAEAARWVASRSGSMRRACCTTAIR